MKTFKYLTILFFTISICSCDKNDNEISEPDFSVLGISTITINNTAYSIKDNLLLEIENTQNIAVSSIQITESTKHCTIEYYVMLTAQETPFVSTTSCFDDVSVSTNPVTTDNEIICIVLNISRNGYNEHATYKFYFANI